MIWKNYPSLFLPRFIILMACLYKIPLKVLRLNCDEPQSSAGIMLIFNIKIFWIPINTYEYPATQVLVWIINQTQRILNCIVYNIMFKCVYTIIVSVRVPRWFTNNNSNWHLHNYVVYHYIVYLYAYTKLWLLTIVLILSYCGFRLQCEYLPTIILFSAHYECFRIILLHFLNKVGCYILLNDNIIYYIISLYYNDGI